jgi:hypothetical protein
LAIVCGRSCVSGLLHAHSPHRLNWPFYCIFVIASLWYYADGEYVSQETHEFVKKVFEKSGIDNNGSYLPKNLHPQHTQEPHGGQDESFAEARLVMGGAVEDLLRKTGAWYCVVQQRPVVWVLSTRCSSDVRRNEVPTAQDRCVVELLTAQACFRKNEALKR